MSTWTEYREALRQRELGWRWFFREKHAEIYIEPQLVAQVLENERLRTQAIFTECGKAVARWKQAKKKVRDL